MKYLLPNLSRLHVNVVIYLIILSNSCIANSKDLISWNPFDLYGDTIKFDVFREGTRVGFHNVTFSGGPGDFWVTTRFELEIKILFISAYAFKYFSKANWKDGVLNEISVVVDDDGEPFSLKGARETEEIMIKSTKSNYRAKLPLFPTNHWNAGVLDQKVVLNTLTGELNQVEIIARGIQTLSSEYGDTKGQRYSYTGDLDTDVWYDEMGRWVGMEFKGRDGISIKYVCRLCLSLKDLN